MIHPYLEYVLSCWCVKAYLNLIPIFYDLPFYPTGGGQLALTWHTVLLAPYPSFMIEQMGEHGVGGVHLSQSLPV